MLRRAVVAVLTVAVVVAVNDPLLAIEPDLRRQWTERVPRYLERLERLERLARREAREARRLAAAAEEEELEESTPAPPAPPASYPSGTIADLIAQIFGANAGDAISVASCESGLDPSRTNASSGAAGLFQLMPFHWQGSFDPYDPAANARYAYGLSAGGSDWGAWASACRP